MDVLTSSLTGSAFKAFPWIEKEVGFSVLETLVRFARITVVELLDVLVERFAMLRRGQSSVELCMGGGRSGVLS